MTTRMYHINPNTGVPSRCYAQNGRCPYGGTSGMSNHYKTYTEAQAHAQEMMEDQYRMLPSHVAEYGHELDGIDDLLEEKMNRDSPAVQEFLNMNVNEQAETIKKTEDNELLMGVINGDIGDGDWRIIGPALQNENVPQELLGEMLFRYPEEFGVETRKWGVTNKSLPADSLRKVLKVEVDDDVMGLAFANGNFERKFINYVVHDKHPRVLARLPYVMIFLDKKNEGIPWVDHLRPEVESHHAYEDSRKRAEELVIKHKGSLDDMR